MRTSGILFLVLFILASRKLAADDWIGLEAEEQPILIGLDLAQEASDSRSQALTLSLPVGDSAGYQGYYARTLLSDGRQEFDSLTLASSVWFELSDMVDIELEHFFEGSDDELEKETFGLALGLSRGNWQFRLHLDRGELLIFTREDISDFLNTFVPDRFSSGVRAAGLTLARQGDRWYWQASHRRYDYERDISPLAQSLFAQFIVKSSALAQSSLLISQNTSFLVGRSDLENDYAFLISRDRSAIDRNDENTYVLSWQHWESQRLGYLLAASMPEALDCLGLSLGLRWVL